MKQNASGYAVGALIAVGFYAVSVFLGSLVNVLIMYASGYGDFQTFLAGGGAAALLPVLITTVANHLLMAWITVRLMTRYGGKHGCVGMKYYSIAASAVFVCAVLVFPILFSSNSGWLTWLTHILGIELFGKRALRQGEDR